MSQRTGPSVSGGLCPLLGLAPICSVNGTGMLKGGSPAGHREEWVLGGEAVSYQPLLRTFLLGACGVSQNES